jgi:hypothetical protein
MMKLSRTLSVLLVGVLGLSARADEKKIAPEKLPAAVKKAVKAAFPKAKVTSAAKEVEEGETVYEVSLTFEGDKYDLSVEPDGTIEEVEREIETEDLPKKVVASLKARYPKAKIKSAEELIKGNILSYEVVLSQGKKEPFEVAVSRNGQIAKAKEEGEGEDDEKSVESKKSKKEGEDKNDDDEKAVKSKKSKKGGEDKDDDDGDDEKSIKAKKSKKGGEDKDDDDEKAVKAKKSKKGGEDKDDDDDDDDK